MDDTDTFDSDALVPRLPFYHLLYLSCEANLKGRAVKTLPRSLCGQTIKASALSGLPASFPEV